MSPRKPWLRFERRGGSPPRDDEELVLAEDGSFTARRTIGGPRIGRFAGELPQRLIRRLRSAVGALETADDIELPTPRHGATEALEVAGKTLRAGSNEEPKRPWRTVLDLVRRTFENDVLDRPLAAVGLVATASSAHLTHLGTGPLEVDPGSIVVNLIRISDGGAVLARWRGGREEVIEDSGASREPPSWLTAEPGWTHELPFDHPIELAPGDWLQVWVELAIRDGDGSRQGKLYVPVLADG